MEKPDVVMRWDSWFRILYINGVRFEDLEPLERNKILGLLFKGGQERATLEQEVEALEAEIEALTAKLEERKTETWLLVTIFFFLAIALVMGGVVVW